MPIVQYNICRVCSSDKLTEVINIGEQYVSTFYVKGDSSRLVKVPIILDLCNNCHLVQQRYTTPNDLLYSKHYWYKSGTTATMRYALADIVDSSIDKLRKLYPDKTPLEKGDIVLDIGSNDGTLLRSYTTEGIIKIGFEPASNLYEEGRQGISYLVCDFWNFDKYIRSFQYLPPQNGGHDTQKDYKKAKIITAIGMFYDLDNPNTFIADVSKALRDDGIFVAQLMCLKQTLEQHDIGNLAHEHLEFYSIESLKYLLSFNGLQIVDIEENNINGGSYRLYITKIKMDKPNISYYKKCKENTFKMFSKESGITSLASFDQFNAHIRDNRQEVSNFVKNAVENGKKVMVYGASTKGNVLLQYYGLDNKLIKFAAEKDLTKVGTLTPGTNINIISEESAKLMMPDYFLVLPYAFKNEFIKKEENEEWRKKGGKFIIPLPKMEIV